MSPDVILDYQLDLQQLPVYETSSSSTIGAVVCGSVDASTCKYLLRATCYLLPIHYYLLPATCYLYHGSAVQIPPVVE